MRTIVIGGTGQVGMATAAQLLALDSEVVIMSRKKPRDLPRGAEWKEGDITNATQLLSLLDKQSPDAVVHLAAYLQYACEQNPAEAVRINVDGTQNVLEACRHIGVPRIVFGSSVGVYGERHDLMHEDDPPTAKTGLYGITKRLGEILGERYAALYGMTFVALRYSGVFGPVEVHSSGMALARQKIRECASGQNVVIDGASGNERVHLTHVKDVALATCRAVLHPRPKYHLYNVGGPAANYLSLFDFYEVVRSLAPRCGRAIWRGQGRSLGPVDISRLRDDLGFDPQISVIEGLMLDQGASFEFTGGPRP